MFDFLKRLSGQSRSSAAAETRVSTAKAGQRHAEEGRRQSEEHFQQLVAGVRDYAVFLLD